jgi:hypothetical protein
MAFAPDGIASANSSQPLAIAAVALPARSLRFGVSASVGGQGSGYVVHFGKPSLFVAAAIRLVPACIDELTPSTSTLRHCSSCP